ncbi:MAG: WYL domain-containing protein [Deltaproteobacteria bacterium]|nr:MAG: WYL domain-containing protein [Deltaproteobacteria bacterium]
MPLEAPRSALSGLVILCGGDDPRRIMTRQDLGRLSSIERTARLVAALLSGREITRQEATSVLGVQNAAADRQLEAIGRHLPLVRERRTGRLHVRIDRSKIAGGKERVPIATLIAGCVGASLAKLFEGTSYEKGMHDLVHHLSRDALHPERFQDFRRQFVFLVRGGEKALPENEEVLEEVVDALQRRRPLQIRYRNFQGARRSVRIEPLSLAVYDHQLYVIGRPRGADPHPYRFSRIESAEPVGGSFPYPDKDSYDPERVFANSFGIAVEEKYPIEQIEVSLAPTWKPFVASHRWHRSQESFVRAGRVHVRLRVRLCPEVVSWILGFGPDARVVGPPQLKRQIAEMVRAMYRVTAGRS